MIKELLRDAGSRMEKSVEHLHEEFTHLRTGRATTGMLEGVTVDYYGTPTPITQVASLNVPDPSLIVVQPWEASMVGPIEKAIMSADLGFNPTNDGKVVRVPIPTLTEERRREISKKAHALAEEARTAVRQIRRDANDELKKALKNKELSEDEEHRALDEVQKLTDKWIGEIDEALDHKEKDLMEV